MSSDSTKRRGPIGFFLRYVPACLAVAGVWIAATPWLLGYLLARHVERLSDVPAGTISISDVSFMTLRFASIASISAGVGAMTILVAISLAIRNRAFAASAQRLTSQERLP